MNLSTLRSLQKRIREATGPDRELDCEIANFHGWRQDADYNYTPSGAMTLDEPPHYTSDPDGLGACVALQRDLLPHLNAHITLYRNWCRVILAREEGSGKTLHEMVVASPERSDDNVCLAYCESIISARIAELEAEQKERVG